MAIEAERLLAIFEAKFDSLDKALAKSRANAGAAFAGIQADGTAAENALAKIGAKGAPGFDKMAKSIQGAKIQTGNLAAQLNDIGVQLAGGQSPFLIALQQGTQINQALGSAGARGAITALGGAFASLVNPVGLATIAIITLGGAAVQYFAGLLSDGEKSAETLKQEAELIQRVADKWGDALPALKAYADERQKLADEKAAVEATQIGKEGAFEDARTQVEALRSDLHQLITDLTEFGGQEAEVGKLQDAFVDLDEKIKNQTATADDAKRVQDLLADAMNSTHIPAAQTLADAFIRVAAALGLASEKALTLDSNLAKIDSDPDTAGPKGFRRSNATPATAPVPEAAPNREDVLAAQDKAAAAAARRAARGSSKRLSADDKIGEDIQAIRDRTAALEQEASMIGLSFEEQQKRKVALDLEQTALKQLREEALKKGQTDLSAIQLSPQQVASINAVADAYAKQAQELKDAREAQALQRDVLQGAFSDLRSALDDGKLDWQDLGNVALNALDKIIDKIENDLVEAILQANSAGGSGGGILGSLLGVLGLGGGSSFQTTPGAFEELLGIPGYASGTGNHPGGLAWVGERGRELVNLPKGSQVTPHDVSERIAAGSQNAGPTISPVFAPQFNSANKEDVPAIMEQLRKFLDKEFLPRTVKAIRQAKPLGLLS